MPGKVKVRVLSARHLPVMDRSSENTDAFAEVKFGDSTHKTEVYRKSLNPAWNSEWFRFEAADDRELQDEPLQIRIMDYDTYSANDAIGKVYVDLNPLLVRGSDQGPVLAAEGLPNAAEGGGSEQPQQPPLPISQSVHGVKSSMMQGWLPIYDTIHGIRGEVNVMVKVDLFSDFNKFRQSSCGVQFFCCPGVPEGYVSQKVNGFVEELVVNDDPEYQWIDKIRTPRASNEARQTLFLKMSGAVQRKIGLKALELGGNSVVGFQIKFDLEGDTGIVVRGIGTAMTLLRTTTATVSSASSSAVQLHKDLAATESAESGGDAAEESTAGMGSSPVAHKSTQPAAAVNGTAGGDHLRRLSPESDFGMGGGPFASGLRHSVSVRPREDLLFIEYPFITLKTFPPGFLQRIGGLVSCRSVKLLDECEEDDGGVTRESWWQEIRQEVRGHARCLGCNVIVGYTEDTAISDDCVVLCASGTAATAELSQMLDLESNGAIFGPPFLPQNHQMQQSQSGSSSRLAAQPDLQRQTSGGGEDCSFLHVPYVDYSLPYTCKLSKCACGKATCKGRVPDIIFSTVEPPPNAPITGRGCLVQAEVLRLKKDLKGEQNAIEISHGLPFVEYEIHRQLINKMKVRGMNALFGMRSKISIGDRTIVATVTATACLLSCLPKPSQPKLICTASSTAVQQDPGFLQKTQKRLLDRVAENEEYYGLGGRHSSASKDNSASDGLDTAANSADAEDGPEADFSSGNKDACVLEIDDSEDADILDSLLDPFPPPMVQVFSTEEMMGVATGHVVRRCQTFSQVWRGRIHPSSRDLTFACQRLLASTYFKLRRLRPCIFSGIHIQADLDEENELQLFVYGSAIYLAHDGKTVAELNLQNSVSDLTLESAARTTSKEDVGSANESEKRNLVIPRELMCRGPTYRKFLTASQDGHAINLTPLSNIPGAKIKRYLGNVSFFLIRETSNLREVGGLNSFIQAFLSEVFSIARSHVRALGGNALVSYFMSEFAVKSQGQCLVHFGGDAVSVAYNVAGGGAGDS